MPLQIAREPDGARVAVGERLHVGRIRPPQASRPPLPRHLRMRRGDRFETCEPRERFAAGGAKTRELEGQRIAIGPRIERGEASVQHCVLGPPDLGVVDVRTRRKRRERMRLGRMGRLCTTRVRKIGEPFDVDVDRIEKPAIGRMVRARALAVARELRVQRIDADDGAPGAGGRRPGLGERRQVADSLIARPTQRIELGREAELVRPAESESGR